MSQLNLLNELKRLGNLAGKGGRVTISVVCEDGIKNSISWASEYSDKEPMMARAVAVLNDGIEIAQEEK